MIEADEQAKLVIGFSSLRHDPAFHPEALDLLKELVSSEGTEETADVAMLHHAFDVLGGKAPLVSNADYVIVSVNVSDAGGHLGDWGAPLEARGAVMRVVESNEALRNRIENLEPAVPY